MDKNSVILRINKLLADYAELRKQAKYDDLSGDYDGHGSVKSAAIQDFSVRAIAAIEAIAPKNSSYTRRIYHSDGKSIVFPNYLVGILEALKKDIEAGYLWKINELIHADIFSDFLEMARYLLKQGYKDSSAVLVGGVLEEHLRKLCVKNDIPIEIKKDEKLEFKKASQMNDDLKRKEIYGNLEHKNITAWLELRNNASHGKYSEYSKEQVELVLTGVRDFLFKFSA